MLNLSPANKVNVNLSKLSALLRVDSVNSSRKLIKATSLLFVCLIIVLFLPWTQNIQSNGKVTTLRPEQRPQTINTIIPGRIEKWFVKDGDIVNKGDTILYLSEIKDGYFDPNLIGRTQSQLKNKELSVLSYEDKINSLDTRVDALIDNGQLQLQQAKLKMQQAQLRVKSDSIEFVTAVENNKIAEQQYNRFEKLKQEKLKSQTELEAKKLAFQRTTANQITTQQKYLQSKNDIIDAKLALNSIGAKFRDEVSKAESDKFSALSNMYDAEIDVTKLQTQVVNYSIRNGMYFILAPQDGVVTKILSSGIGETIKEGDAIATIMPAKYDLALETYVQPMDLPLLQKGQSIRIQFDGWPSIVFSGWPNASFGTFGGKILAVDNFANSEGTFRVLVVPDNKDQPWPNKLRVGGGAKTMVMLNDVKVGYELWRLINGFPPDFYASKQMDKKPGK
jgi:multidrug efflux pump subunit AcrA (membrane-fusion protein)